MNLLTSGNPKIAKGKKLGYLTHILHLAPHWLSGFNTCPMATKGCSMSCLNTAGRGGMFAGQKTAHLTGAEMLTQIKNGTLVNRIQAARVRKTKMFFTQRTAFMTQLASEIKTAIKRSMKHGLIPVFRLNGTSDIRWEVYPVTVDGVEYPNIMSAFPNVQFYDYTKIPNRRNLPSNYHLTFSLAESNEQYAVQAIVNGLNVAVVFRSKDYPKMYLNLPVVNGDDTDLRFLDPKGVVVGLFAKGKAKKDTSGFVKETH